MSVIMLTNGRNMFRRGFTMLELLITIGIIVLLAGLTLTVVSSMTSKSEVRQTENTLRILETALQQWEVSADRLVRVGPEDGGFDVEFEANGWEDFAGNALDVLADESIELTRELYVVLDRNPSAQTAMANIDAAFLTVNPDENEVGEHPIAVQDPWETQIIAVFPGRTWFSGGGDQGNFGDPDEDGTIRTPFEDAFGVCVNQRPFFVSAGPDGKFGDLTAAEDDPLYLATQDNVWSSKVIRPEQSP